MSAKSPPDDEKKFAYPEENNNYLFDYDDSEDAGDQTNNNNNTAFLMTKTAALALTTATSSSSTTTAAAMTTATAPFSNKKSSNDNISSIYSDATHGLNGIVSKTPSNKHTPTPISATGVGQMDMDMDILKDFTDTPLKGVMLEDKFLSDDNHYLRSQVALLNGENETLRVQANLSPDSNVTPVSIDYDDIFDGCNPEQIRRILAVQDQLQDMTKKFHEFKAAVEVLRSRESSYNGICGMLQDLRIEAERKAHRDSMAEIGSMHTLQDQVSTQAGQLFALKRDLVDVEGQLSTDQSLLRHASEAYNSKQAETEELQIKLAAANDDLDTASDKLQALDGIYQEMKEKLQKVEKEKEMLDIELLGYFDRLEKEREAQSAMAQELILFQSIFPNVSQEKLQEIKYMKGQLSSDRPPFLERINDFLRAVANGEPVGHLLAPINCIIEASKYLRMDNEGRWIDSEGHSVVSRYATQYEHRHLDIYQKVINFLSDTIRRCEKKVAESCDVADDDQSDDGEDDSDDEGYNEVEEYDEVTAIPILQKAGWTIDLLQAFVKLLIDYLDGIGRTIDDLLNGKSNSRNLVWISALMIYSLYPLSINNNRESE